MAETELHTVFTHRKHETASRLGEAATILKGKITQYNVNDRKHAENQTEFGLMFQNGGSDA